MITFREDTYRTYIPSQPEIQFYTDSYVELHPDTLFHDDISIFYQFKTNEKSIHSLFLIPDGCFDILFCCSPINPSVILWTSPLQRRIQPNFQPNCEYFGIRFLPEQGLIKLNHSMKELLGQQIPLFDVWEAEINMVEEIGEASTFLERIEIFKKYLKRYYYDNEQYDHKIIRHSIRDIYFSNGGGSITDLAEKIGYTDRYIRKKFEEFIGFSPKQFSQIIRFQKSVKTLLHTPNTGYLKITEENGYYDQTHFNKGFKKYMQLTPTQYIIHLTNE
jgi:AraC-like DNA-binding protein